MRNRTALAIAALSFAWVCPPTARADQVVVFSTVAAKSALESIAPEFERDTKQKVVLRFATAAELKAEIEKGAACDVALLTAAGVDDLVKQGKLTASTRMVAFKSGVGIAGRKGAAPVKVATTEELKGALLDARAIAMSTAGATGPIMKRAFERMGITEAMAPKTVLVSSITAPEAVVRGQAELAFTQVSEILDTPGAELLGPLPPDLQSLSTFAAAVSSGTNSGEAAQAFLKALATPRAAGHMRAKGLLPE